MKPVSALLIGSMLAFGLALAAQAAAPEDVVARIIQAQDEQDLASTYSDWHPAAEHKIIVKYELGHKDDVFSYTIADYAKMDIPDVTKAQEGYREINRSTPSISAPEGDGSVQVTAVTHVTYDWQGYSGEMVQTDVFVFENHLGGRVIRSLTTTYDYR